MHLFPNKNGPHLALLLNLLHDLHVNGCLRISLKKSVAVKKIPQGDVRESLDAFLENDDLPW